MGLKSNMLRRLTVFTLLAAAVGCESLDTDDSGRHTLNLDGRVAVIVVDNSGGPEEFDPDGVLREGVKFLLFSFSDEDNVGIVTVRFPVEALLPITCLGSGEARENASDAIDRMKVGGDAEYFIALDKARELLSRFSAERDSAVVFLTGGRKRPSGNPNEIRDLMKLFASRGWRFFPVVLMPAPDLMGVLEEGAAMTQGAVFRIERPQDILPSLVTVGGKINDFWIRRTLETVDLPEGATRLMMTVVKSDDESGLSGVTHGSTQVPLDSDSGKVKTASNTEFDSALIPKPEAGSWSGTVKGTAAAEAMFVKPPFEVYLDDAATVKGSATEGDEVGFELVVRGEKSDVDAWGPESSADVTVSSEKTGKPVDYFPMEKTVIPPEIRFTGRTRLFTSEPGAPEVFTARVTLVFGADSRRWVREEFISFELKSTASLLFRVEPSELDLGVRWSDEKDITRNVEIIARVDEPVEVRIESLPETLTSEPMSVTSSKSSSGVFKISLADKAREEAGEGTLSFKVQGVSETPEGPSFERIVKVRYRLLKFRGPDSVPVGPLVPGSEVEVPLSGWAVDGGAVPISVRCDPLEGPGILVPSVQESEGRRFLKILIPENAAPGTYEGRILVVPDDPGLSPRRIPVSVEVVPPATAVPADEGDEPSLVPETPGIEHSAAASGWSTATILLSAREGRPAVTVLEIKKSSLRGKARFETVSAQFDMQVSPAPGWNGKDLAPGRQAGIKVEFFVSSDLPDDIYEGEISILYKVGDDINTRELKIPVQLLVARKR